MLEKLIEPLAHVEAWMLALLPVALLTYFVPVLIAYARRHRYVWPIGALNFIIGWTAFGWLASLLWALNRDVRQFAEARPAPERQPDRPARALPTAPPQEPRWGLGQVPASPAAVQYKKCPDCMQPVRMEATACRSCGHDFRRAASATAPVRPVAPVRELDRREPRAFTDARREAVTRPLDQSTAESPRVLRPGRSSGRPGTQGEDSDWLYDVPGIGERRH